MKYPATEHVWQPPQRYLSDAPLDRDPAFLITDSINDRLNRGTMPSGRWSLVLDIARQTGNQDAATQSSPGNCLRIAIALTLLLVTVLLATACVLRRIGQRHVIGLGFVQQSLQEGTTPTAACSRAKAFAQLAGDARTMNADMLNDLTFGHMKAQA